MLYSRKTSLAIIMWCIIATIGVLILSLINWKLGIGILLFIAGWILYQKNQIYFLASIPATMIVGNVLNIVVLGYRYEISLLEISIIAFTLYFLIDTIRNKVVSLRVTSVGLLLGMYVLLNIVSLAWAIDASRLIIAVRVLMYQALYFLLIINICKNSNDIKKALWGLPLAGIAIALQLLYTVFRLGGFSGIIVPREYIITNAGPWVTISAMIFLSVPIVYALYFNAKNQKTKKWIIAVCLLLFLSGFLALGKIEIAALAIGSIYFFAKSKKLKKKYAIAGIIIAVIISFSPFFAYAQEFWKRIQETFSGSDSLNFRLEEWRVGLLSFVERPFLGVGAGNLKVLYQMKHSCHCSTEANNAILQIGVEFGVVGLLLIILAISDIWSRLKMLSVKIVDEKDKLLILALKTSLFMAAIMSMAEVTFFGLNFGILFWYLIACVAVWSDELLKKR